MTKKWTSLILITSLLTAVSFYAKPLSAWADPSYSEVVEEVANDRFFTRIQAHLRYGDVTPPEQIAMPYALSDFRKWIAFFDTGNEDNLPALDLGGDAPTPMKTILHEIIPSYLGCFDNATQQCNKAVYDFMKDRFRRTVRYPIEQQIEREEKVRDYYKAHYEMYQRALARELEQDPPTVTRRDASGKVISAAWTAGSFANDVRGVSQHFAAGTTQAVATPLGIWQIFSALKNIYEAITGIFSYQRAGPYAIRSLAYLKLYLLYERKVIPYLRGVYEASKRVSDQLESRFNETTCWSCQGEKPDTGAAGADVQTVCPHMQLGNLSSPPTFQPPEPQTFQKDIEAEEAEKREQARRRREFQRRQEERRVQEQERKKREFEENQRRLREHQNQRR